MKNTDKLSDYKRRLLIATKAKEAIIIAEKEREQWEEYKKGILLFYQGRILHHTESERLPSPHIWEEGVLAVLPDNIVWSKKGICWEAVYYDDFPEIFSKEPEKRI